MFPVFIRVRGEGPKIDPKFGVMLYGCLTLFAICGYAYNFLVQDWPIAWLYRDLEMIGIILLVMLVFAGILFLVNWLSEF